MCMIVPKALVILSGKEWSRCFVAATSGSSKIGNLLKDRELKSKRKNYSLEFEATT